MESFFSTVQQQQTRDFGIVFVFCPTLVTGVAGDLALHQCFEQLDRDRLR